jgi:hypothetical protein
MGRHLELSKEFMTYFLISMFSSDDLKVGKHCIYNKQIGASLLNKKLRWTKHPNPWLCQQCVPDGSCKPLERLGRCHSFPKYLDSGDVNEVHRVETKFNPYSKDKSSVLVYNYPSTNQPGGQVTKQYPKCSAVLSLPCFDLSRCTNLLDGESPLRVYSYGGPRTDQYLNYTMTQQSDLLEIVDDPKDACLFVMAEKTFTNPQDLLHAASWNGGQNHYIHNSEMNFESHQDHPFNEKTNFGLAAISGGQMDDAYLREGYDIPLFSYPQWKRPPGFDSLDIHRERKYLISFKGAINPWEERSYQHRWIAAEYWYGEDDVHVDVKCENAKRVVNDYSNKEPDDYGNLLLGSTFFFCPGGGGVNSYRFIEALLAGSIPVVTSDFLTPFEPDIDWSGCVVKFSDVRVVDIPRIVRGISAREVKQRQVKCAQLVDGVFGEYRYEDNMALYRSGGSTSFQKHPFYTAMKIWKVRIVSALNRQVEMNAII